MKLALRRAGCKHSLSQFGLCNWQPACNQCVGRLGIGHVLPSSRLSRKSWEQISSVQLVYTLLAAGVGTWPGQLVLVLSFVLCGCCWLCLLAAQPSCFCGIWKAPSPNVASPATSRHEVSWTSKFACPASHNKTRGKLSFPVSSDACLASMVALPWAWRPIGCSLAQSESPSKSWKPLQALCLRSLTWPSEFQAIILAPEHGPFLRLKLPLRHRAGVALMAMHTQSPSNLGHWLLGMLIQPAQAECDQQVSFLDPVPHFELGQLRPLRLSSDTCARCLRLDVALALRTVWQAARLGFRVGRVERHVLHFVCQWQWVQRPKSPAWWTLRHALAPGSRTTANFVRATSGARYPKDCSARKALQGQMVRCAMVRLQGETEHPVLNSGNTRVMVVVREAWAWFNFGAAEAVAALHIPGAFAQRLEFQTWSFACYGFRHVRTACGWQAVACLQGSAHIFLGQLCFAHSLSSLQSVCQAKGRANIVWVKAQHFVQAQPRTKLMACLFATLALHQQLRFAELWQAIRRTEVLIRRRPLLAVLLAPAALKPAAKRSHQARIRQAEPAVRQFCDAPLASTRLIPAKVCLHGNMPRIDIHAVLQGGLPVGRMLPSITLSVQQQFFLANQETKFFVCLQRIARRSLPARLIRAAVAVLQLRHSVLRTSFVLNKHGGFQQQTATCLLDDAVEVCHVQTDAEAMKRAHEFAHALMDLQQVPIRVLCVEICGESPETSKTMIVLKVHHIAIDGRSMAMLDAQLCELVELGLENDAGLEAKKASRYYLCTLVTSELLQLLEFFFHGGHLPEDIPQYADYVTWVQDYMRSAEYQLDLAHWTAQLGSVSSLPVLSIPVDKPRPRHSGLDAHVGIVDVHFPDDFLGRFKSTDAFPFVLTIFAMALCLWSRQDAVVIGSPVFGVPSVDFARVVGCTSHLIPYVIQMPRPFSLPKLLRALCDMVSSAMKHGTVPLQESPLWPGNTDASQPHPLYQVIVTWQPRGGWARRGKGSDAWEMKQFIGPSPLMADLVLDAYEKDKIVDGQRITFRRRGRSIAAAGPLQQGQGVKDMLAKLQDKYLDVSSFEVVQWLSAHPSMQMRQRFQHRTLALRSCGTRPEKALPQRSYVAEFLARGKMQQTSRTRRGLGPSVGPAPSRWQAALVAAGRSLRRRVPDIASFAAALAACQEAAQWRQALQLFLQLPEGRASARLAVLGACERSAMWRQALLLRDGSEKAICTSMSACSRALQWQRALLLLQEVRAQRLPDAQTLTTAISACGRGRRWQMAIDLAADLRSRGLLDAVALSCAVTALTDAQRWRHALALAPVPSSAELCHALLSAFETSSRWWQAVALLQEALGRQLSTSAVALNSACSACEKASQWELAASLLQGPVTPDAITHSAVVAACSRASRWRYALPAPAGDLPSAAAVAAASPEAGHLNYARRLAARKLRPGEFGHSHPADPQLQTRSVSKRFRYFSITDTCSCGTHVQARRAVAFRHIDTRMVLNALRKLKFHCQGQVEVFPCMKEANNAAIWQAYFNCVAGMEPQWMMKSDGPGAKTVFARCAVIVPIYVDRNKKEIKVFNVWCPEKKKRHWAFLEGDILRGACHIYDTCRRVFNSQVGHLFGKPWSGCFLAELPEQPGGEVKEPTICTYIKLEQDGHRYPCRPHFFLQVTEDFLETTRCYEDANGVIKLPQPQGDFVKWDDLASARRVHLDGTFFMEHDEARWVVLEYETGKLLVAALECTRCWLLAGEGGGQGVTTNAGHGIPDCLRQGHVVEKLCSGKYMLLARFAHPDAHFGCQWLGLVVRGE
ncbi:unnamed protein product [Effrenium voratum]|nr:unnamed protein product [Effrenium voratum]